MILIGFLKSESFLKSRRNKRHVPESSPSSYSSTHYNQPAKRQFTNNFELLESGDFQYDGLNLNYENDHQNVASSSSPSIASKSLTFEMPLTTPIKGQSQTTKGSRVINFTPWNTKDWVDLFTFDNKPM